MTLSMVQAATRAETLAVPAGKPALRETAPQSTQAVQHRVGRKRLVVTLIALVVAAAVAALVTRAVARPALVPTAMVALGAVRQETLGPGTVQSRFPVKVGSRMTGTVDRVLVDVGDEVTKGQLLATLDPTELRARSASARRAVASAQQEVALAEANLAKARSDVELARANYQRAEKLVRPGVVSLADYDQTKAALSASEANELAARVAIDARRADLARLDQDARVADTVLSYASIVSPMAGVITRRALEAGSTVGPGVTMFEMVDANALWIATLIDESQTGWIEVGQHAVIHLRSGANVAGHVSRVTFNADPVTRELEVDVAFDSRPSRFAINEEADVTILGSEQTGPTIPLTAVNHGADGDVVFVVENGKSVRHPIRLGATGRGRALVTEGLRPGDQVILAPQIVNDGQRVVGANGG